MGCEFIRSIKAICQTESHQEPIDTRIYTGTYPCLAQKRNVQRLNLRFHWKYGRCTDARSQRKNRASWSKIKRSKNCDCLSNPLTFIQFVFPFGTYDFFFHSPFCSNVYKERKKNNNNRKSVSLCCVQKWQYTHQNKRKNPIQQTNIDKHRATSQQSSETNTS